VPNPISDNDLQLVLKPDENRPQSSSLASRLQDETDPSGLPDEITVPVLFEIVPGELRRYLYRMQRYSTDMFEKVNIYFGGDFSKLVTLSISPSEWEDGVRLQLDNLFKYPPMQTSQVVLNTIKLAARHPKRPKNASLKVYIVPREAGNATTEPMWDREKTDCVNGWGSSALIRYTPQYFRNNHLPGDGPDETLLHEMVHAMQYLWGNEWLDSSTLLRAFRGQLYDNLGEFLAILITNIYRSENKRPFLRQDHTGGNILQETYPGFTDGYDLTKPQDFCAFWEPELRRLQWHDLVGVFANLAEVRCAWNPLRYLL
jgi:hypothetical protein